jgi:trans-aconitate 2-methyltransferase
MTDGWSAQHYLGFGNERTRAAQDLVARVDLAAPGQVFDLGCGPGNSTALLRQRWPQATLTGVDSSPEMLAAAHSAMPDVHWQLADLAQWEPPAPVDLLFSNAALHWLPDHGALLPRLFGYLKHGGALALQIPSRQHALVRDIIHEISRDPRWSDRLEGARAVLTMERPAFYYDVFAPLAQRVDIWETEYFHVMSCSDAIVEFIGSTGLRPFIAPLTDEECEVFVNRLRSGVRAGYASNADGQVLFPSRRTFVVAYRL